jgi:hypothetical protein
MSADDDIIDAMTGIKPALPPAVAGNRLKRADPKKHLAPEKLYQRLLRLTDMRPVTHSD